MVKGGRLPHGRVVTYRTVVIELSGHVVWILSLFKNGAVAGVTIRRSSGKLSVDMTRLTTLPRVAAGERKGRIGVIEDGRIPHARRVTILTGMA